MWVIRNYFYIVINTILRFINENTPINPLLLLFGALANVYNIMAENTTCV